MEQFNLIAQVVGFVVGGLILLACACLVLWFLIRGRYQKEVHQTEAERLRPYEEAAAGYRLQVDQLKGDVDRLEHELASANQERDTLRKRVRELEGDYLKLAQANQKQQGEIDVLKRRVEDMNDLRAQLLEAVRALKA